MPFPVRCLLLGLDNCDHIAADLVLLHVVRMQEFIVKYQHHDVIVLDPQAHLAPKFGALFIVFPAQLLGTVLHDLDPEEGDEGFGGV